MKNGFVIAPIIIWVVIGLFTVTAATEAGLIQFDPSGEKGFFKMPSKQADNQQPSPAPIVIPTPAPLTESNLIDPVIVYYSNLTSKNYSDAWNLLSKNNQSTGPITNLDDFSKDFEAGGLIDISVKDISVKDLKNHLVSADIKSSFMRNGKTQSLTFIDTWKLIQEDGAWKLDSLEQESTVCTTTHTGNHLNIPKSVCGHSLDCQIGDKWIFYTSEDQCTKDQQKNIPNAIDTYLNEAMANYNKCKEDHPGFSGFDECRDETRIFISALRGKAIEMGADPIKYELEDKISELEDKQTKLKQDIEEIGNCNRSGGRWTGFWCEHY